MHICPFEILHFAPLILIALTAFSLGLSNARLPLSASIAILSIIGLFAGGHMHTEHLEPYGIVDPCYGYAFSLLVSAVIVTRELLTKKTAKGKA
jgi:hydrogenase/urease accessory protein HupE